MPHQKREKQIMATKKKKTIIKKKLKRPPPRQVKRGPPPRAKAIRKGAPKSAAKRKAPPLAKKKPRAKAPVAKKVKKPAVSLYRNLRKWTLPKIDALLAEGVAAIRARLSLPPDTAPLLAVELVAIMRLIEAGPAAWRREGPQRRGRPRKGAEKKTTTPSVADPAATLARIASGLGLMPPRAVEQAAAELFEEAVSGNPEQLADAEMNAALHGLSEG